MKFLLVLVGVLAMPLWGKTPMNQPKPSSSTFVGNGGSLIEAELEISKSQLKKVLLRLGERDSMEGVCECSSYLLQSPMCKFLGSLSEEQSAACEDFLTKAQRGMLMALGKTDFYITKNSLSQKRSYGNWREVSGGADRETHSIVLGERDFLSLSTAERIMLLGHELGHLVPYNGSMVDDTTPVLKAKDGGRMLLDSIGAALGVRAMLLGIVPSPADDNESVSYADIYLSASSTQIMFHGKNSVFTKSLEGPSFIAEYQLYPYGISLETGTQRRQTYVGAIRSYLKREFLSIGVKNRFSLFSSSPEFLLRHTSLDLGACLAFATYSGEISDSFFAISAGAKKTLEPGLSAKVVVPVARGFHGFLETKFGWSNFSLEKEIFKHKGMTQTLSMGVSYGF